MVIKDEINLFPIKKAVDINVSKEPKKFLLTSSYGGGKTHLAGEFNKRGGVFFYDFDDGMTTLRGKEGITFVTYKRDLTNRRLYHQIMSSKNIVEKMVNEEVVKTVVLDSLTTFAEVVLDGVLGDGGKTRQFVSLPEWGEQMNRIQDFLSWMGNLNCDTIVTAHEQMRKDEITGRVWCLPLVTGKLAERIGIYFDEIYHLEVKTTKDGRQYKMLTSSDSWYSARSRLGYAEAWVPTSFDEIEKVRRG